MHKLLALVTLCGLAISSKAQNALSQTRNADTSSGSKSTRPHGKTIAYASDGGTPQAAVNAACDGTTPGTVVFPAGITTTDATIRIPSFCTISGRGKDQSLIQASSGFTSASILFLAGGNIQLENIGIDGNRSLVTSNPDCILIQGAHDVSMNAIRASNCLQIGVRLFGSNNTRITLENSEIFNNGAPAAASQVGSGVFIQNGDSSHVLITTSRIHDNNSGVIVANSGTVGVNVVGVEISSNRIYGNANDAVLVTTSSESGGDILGLRFEKNEIYCNGWPANGIGFSSACSPGFQQDGTASSQGGVGVDLIQQGVSHVLRPIVAHNHIHDDVFEGVASTTNINSIVNTSGTTATRVSGPPINTALIAGQKVLVNGKPYTLATSPASTGFSTTTSLGKQIHVDAQFPGYMGAIITGNDVSDSGNVAIGAGVGPCFYNQLSDGNIYIAEIPPPAVSSKGLKASSAVLPRTRKTKRMATIEAGLQSATLDSAISEDSMYVTFMSLLRTPQRIPAKAWGS